MGYKLAGLDVLGGLELEENTMKLYRANHNPRYSFLAPIQEFNQWPEECIPEELFDLDILDGSPPCSAFSIAGKRQSRWGQTSDKFAGHAQVIDDLFFHFIETVSLLRPRVVIAENVKGLIIGNARGYVTEIFAAFNRAGYDTQLFLLNASRMGVPQIRERTFFVARRKDLSLRKINFEFNEPPIAIGDVFRELSDPSPDEVASVRRSTELCKRYWSLCSPGKSFGTVHPGAKWFSRVKIHPRRPINTLTTHSFGDLYHWSEPRNLYDGELIAAQTFPVDYDFQGHDVGYVVGRSVPPLMMQRIASAVRDQLFG